MKKLLTNIAYFLVLATICSVISVLVGKVVESSKTPPEDINATAYQHLVLGWKTTDLQQSKANADYAIQLATDPELKSFATLLSKQAEYCLKQGHKATGENKTLAGNIKTFLAGVEDPLLWLDGLGLAWDTYLAESEKLAQRIDNRYQTYFRQIKSAQNSGGTAAFWSFVILLGISIALRKPILNRIGTQPSVMSFSHTKAINDALVTCPSCGARNRNKVLAAGQKLVCGQCKTVLLSVS